MPRLFTRENAAALGAKGGRARVANCRARKAEALRKPNPVVLAATLHAVEIAQEIAWLRKHMARINEALALSKTERAWDSLTKAHQRLFQAWVWLAQIPGPGQFKPERSVPPKSLGFGPLISNNPPAEQPVDVQPLTPNQPGAQEVEVESPTEPPPN